VDEPEGRATDGDPVALVVDLRHCAPDVAGGGEQLLDLVELVEVAVPLVAGVQGEAESGLSPSAMRTALRESMFRSCSSSSPATFAVRSAISSELGCWPYG
jgi:hypothetical protein